MRNSDCQYNDARETKCFTVTLTNKELFPRFEQLQHVTAISNRFKHAGVGFWKPKTNTSVFNYDVNNRNHPP